MVLFRLVVGDSELFSLYADSLRRWGEIWHGGRLLHVIFTPSVQRCWCGSENCKFYEVLEYQCPEGAYPLVRILQNFRSLWAVPCSVHILDLGIRSGGSKVIRILPRGAFPGNF